MNTPRLLKKDVLALPAYKGVERRLALAIGVSAQAISLWSKYVPQQRVWQLLMLHPELEKKTKTTTRRRSKATA